MSQSATGSLPPVVQSRGGLVVDIGLPGSVSLSQLASVGNLGTGERSVVLDALRDYVGKRLPLKVIEADQRRDRLILSEKAAAQQLRRRRKEEASSQPGIKVIEPTTLCRRGESVRVLVTGVDRERGRISLSIKRQEEGEDHWTRAPRELAVGTDLDATVTRVTPHGAFARMPMGIKGLVHISELAPRRIATPAEVVHPGDLVRVRVVAIDPGDVDCLCPYVKRQEMSCTQLGQTKSRTYNRNQMLDAAIYL